METDFAFLSEAFREIFSPDALEEVARETGFIQREGKMKATDFLSLCAFLNDRSGQKSLIQLCSALNSNRAVNLSVEGLNQRFNERASAFVKKVFPDALSRKLQSEDCLPTKFRSFFKRIRILDSSSFGLPSTCEDHYKGSTGAGMKVQLEYDLLSGSFLHMEVQNGIESDLNMGMELAATLQPLDLIIRDLGYFTYANLLEIEARQASYISRLRPASVIFEKQGDEFIRLNLENVMEKMTCGEMQELNDVYIGGKHQLRTRLIICKLTEEQTKMRLVLKQKKESRSGVKRSPLNKKLAALNLYITNLPASQATKLEVHELYTLRWQVEILFKTWKSIYKIHCIKKMKVDRFECHLYGTLLTLLVSSLIMFQIRYLLYEKKKKEASEYKGMELIKEYLVLLQHALFNEPSALMSVLNSIYKTIEKNGRKSHRYKKLSVFEILGLAIDKQTPEVA